MTLWDGTRSLSPRTSEAPALCTIRSPAPTRAQAARGSTGLAKHPDFMISLTVPGTLSYRPLVLRVVESSCKLVTRSEAPGGAHGPSDVQGAARTAFEDEVVSAFSEAFNNVVMHGYADYDGDVQIEIEPDEGGITIRMLDVGRSFDPTAVVAPRLDELPESGMGLYIIHSFMDHVSYRPGDPPRRPNLLVLKKSLRRGTGRPPGARENPK